MKQRLFKKSEFFSASRELDETTHFSEIIFIFTFHSHVKIVLLAVM